MEKSIKRGFSFALVSGIITVLGIMVGLNSTTHSEIVIIGGIIVLAISDSLSDSFGIHISEESQKRSSSKSVWKATIAAFITKLVIVLTFVIPVLFLSLNNAIIVGIIWGVLLITIFSYRIAKTKKEKPWRVIGEHLLITAFIVIITHYVGKLISGFSVG
ncbi:MAG TPA: hypothetical protein VJ912_03410 [Candidatus Nanoarchaeia archaeon]|nr:hypothetical protein [Candidatus Nanoarchaeia archaeon]